MKQLPSDKYNVAWFKLAEFVARGEKERALGLYKLLAHSFDDQALSTKLEGDILLSFNDQLAFDRYKKAALLYASERRAIDAAAVYEHLITHNAINQEELVMLLLLYQDLKINTRFAVHVELLCDMLGRCNELHRLEILLLDLESKLNNHQLGILNEKIALAHYKYHSPHAIVLDYVRKAIGYFEQETNALHLQQFLSVLDATHVQLGKDARAYVARK